MKLTRLLTYALAIGVVIVSCFPLVYAIGSSLKTGNGIFNPALWPQDPSVANYVGLVTGNQAFGSYIWNSIAVAVLTVVIAMVIAVSAAYALGRISFKGRGALLLAILAVSMFPQVAILSGMFELIRWMGLYNKALGLIVPYTVFTLPFTVWVLTTFMRELPLELQEAAIMDGCGVGRIIFQVFMPLLWPALVSTGLLAFIGAWNEFLFALTFVIDDSQRTVPVGISLISGATSFEIPWGSIMAASVIVTVPLLVLVFVFQKRIVSGLTAGAVKG
ncbi:UgpE ABC-type sugar transport system, permease component [Burkholderiales bacterium]|jgi:trehalose/maltose transport system permease protein